MKNYKVLLVLIVTGLIFSSCEDFLNPDPTPDAAIAGVNFPSDQDELEFLLVGVYDGVKGINGLQFRDTDLNHGIQREFYVTEMLSDNSGSANGESGEASQFDFFQVVSTNGFVFDHYRSAYSVIFRANQVLENLDVAEGDGSRIEAEARFIRAWMYFNLVRSYGDVPLVLETIGPFDEEIQFTRVPTVEVYDVIISDLEFALGNLTNTTNQYRASIPAAQGMLATVHLTVGNYLAAQGLLEEIINSGQYSLEPDFRDVFFNENNNETIFAIGYVPDNAENSQDFSAEMRGGNIARSSGQNYATADLISAMGEFGGNRTEFTLRADPLTPSRTQAVKFLPDGEESLEIEATGGNPQLAGNDWIVLRYADVLLMHAESILAGQLTTPSSNAIASFQLVRDRAGLVDPVVTELTRDNLLLERRVELAFENKRLYDLKRFGVAQEVLSAFSNSIGGAFTATDLLLPIPQFEINLSNDGLLEQNPGY